MNTEVKPKIVKFKYTEKSLFHTALLIRKRVFVEEQNVDEKEEFDEFEKSSMHYLLFEKKKAIATARCRTIDEKIKLERFAVLKEFRRKGFGQILLEKMLADLKPMQKTIYLHAQLPAIPLYKNAGFVVVGNQFIECDIAHYKMVFDFKGE